VGFGIQHLTVGGSTAKATHVESANNKLRLLARIRAPALLKLGGLCRTLPGHL